MKYIRPIIALSFVATTLILAYTGKIEAEKIYYITSIIVAFYFAERAALKKPGGDTVERKDSP